jgi:hypothetical protein
MMVSLLVDILARLGLLKKVFTYPLVVQSKQGLFLSFNQLQPLISQYEYVQHPS